jgi:hypothetical protein
VPKLGWGGAALIFCTVAEACDANRDSQLLVWQLPAGELGAMLMNDSAVNQALTGWRTANRDIELSDYFDDMEREFDELEHQGARNRIIAS